MTDFFLLRQESSRKIIGIENLTKENSCYVNVVIQAIYHFNNLKNALIREVFDSSKQSLKVLIELQKIIKDYDRNIKENVYQDNTVLSSLAVRKELAAAFEKEDIYKLNETGDPIELLNCILKAYHTYLIDKEYNNIFLSEPPSCLNKCLVHQMFELSLREVSQCTKCVSSKPNILEYDSNLFLFVLYTKEILRYCKVNLYSLDEIKERMLYLSQSVRVQEASKCDKCNMIKVKSLRCSYMGDYMILNCAWTNDEKVRMEHIIKIYYMIPLFCSNNDLFDCDKTIKKQSFELSGLILYFLNHYVSAFKEGTNGKWTFYDDEKGNVIDSWEDLVAYLVKNHYRPVGIFYKKVSNTTQRAKVLKSKLVKANIEKMLDHYQNIEDEQQKEIEVHRLVLLEEEKKENDQVAAQTMKMNNDNKWKCISCSSIINAVDKKNCKCNRNIVNSTSKPEENKIKDDTQKEVKEKKNDNDLMVTKNECNKKSDEALQSNNSFLQEQSIPQQKTTLCKSQIEKENKNVNKKKDELMKDKLIKNDDSIQKEEPIKKKKLITQEHQNIKLTNSNYIINDDESIINKWSCLTCHKENFNKNTLCEHCKQDLNKNRFKTNNNTLNEEKKNPYEQIKENEYFCPKCSSKLTNKTDKCIKCSTRDKVTTPLSQRKDSKPNTKIELICTNSPNNNISTIKPSTNQDNKETKQEDTWKCDHCKTENKYTSDKCCKCDTKNKLVEELLFQRKLVATGKLKTDQFKRYSSQPPIAERNAQSAKENKSIISNGKWKCSKCKMENYPKVLFCHYCGQFKNEKTIIYAKDIIDIRTSQKHQNDLTRISNTRDIKFTESNNEGSFNHSTISKGITKYQSVIGDKKESLKVSTNNSTYQIRSKYKQSSGSVLPLSSLNTSSIPPSTVCNYSKTMLKRTNQKK